MGAPHFRLGEGRKALLGEGGEHNSLPVGVG